MFFHMKVPEGTFNMPLQYVQLQRRNLTTMYSLLNPLALWLLVLFLLMLLTLTSVSSSNFPRSSIESVLKRFSPSSTLRFTSTLKEKCTGMSIIIPISNQKIHNTTIRKKKITSLDRESVTDTK